MRLIKFTSISVLEGKEIYKQDIWINPDQVVFVFSAAEKPESAMIRLTNGAFTVTDSPVEAVKKLRFDRKHEQLHAGGTED